MHHIQTISERTPLGTWQMHVCHPRGLGHVVESIWEVRGTVAHTRARHFPTGAVDVLVNLGDRQVVLGDSRMERFGTDDVWLSGVQSRPVVVESEPFVHLFAIRLRAAFAAAVLRAPMRLTARTGLRMDLFDRRAAAALLLGVQRGRTFVGRLAAACRWIEGQCGGVPRRGGYVEWIAAAIEAAQGNVPIDRIRRDVGVSRKALARDFSEQVGATPKLLARIHRFRHARLLIQRPGVPLADTAVDAGYFDQAHMSRDFRDLGDLTPGEYLASCYPDGQSGVIAVEG